ncbi:MAG: DUF2207 domain-containing protein, partial [Patescibacteria group bacterium]
QFLPFFIPLTVFLVCFLFWKKYGNDKKDSRSVIAQYEPPKEFSLLELSAITNNGHFQTKAITAEIFNLAVKGYLKIEAKDEKIFTFTKTEKPTEALSRLEKELLKTIFKKNNSFEFSKGYNPNLANIMKFSWSTEISKELTIKDILDKKANKAFWILLVIVAIIGTISYLIFKNIDNQIHLIISLILSVLIFVLFAYFMKKLTPKGQDVLWQTKGFQLYMNTAEKYREQFNEKENIFEKFLPYAMLFGLTKIWINKMKQIYGENYFNSYHPAWFVGANLVATNFDQIESAISTISNNLNSAMTSSSGSGGSGFSGGGGGGGGGGGW